LSALTTSLKKNRFIPAIARMMQGRCRSLFFFGIRLVHNLNLENYIGSRQYW
jgi:hypothetical protein